MRREKGVRSTLSFVFIFALVLSLMPMWMLTVRAATATTYSFGYAYDAQRSPAYPTTGDICVSQGFSGPLDANGSHMSETAGEWTLTFKGAYKDNKDVSTKIAGVISSVKRSYNLSSEDEIPIYELKEGTTHVAYGVLCAITSDEKAALFIGDTWNGGAGYVLSATALQDSFEFTVNLDIADQVAESSSTKIELSADQCPTAIADLTYTGELQALVKAPTANLPDGAEAIVYALGESDQNVPTDGWSEEIPKAKDAGTYYVWYKAIATDSEYDSEPACITVTISGNETEPTEEPTEEKVSYDQVPVSGGVVKDITGSEEATAETNTYSVKIENSEELEKILGITEEEKAQGVNVWLEIKDASSTMAQTDKDIISKTAGNATVGLFIDATLFKKVGDSDPTKVTETKGVLKFSVTVPANLRKDGRVFGMVRSHNGVGSTVTGSYNATSGVFTGETSEFSAYALVYTDEAKTTTTATTSTTTTGTVSPKTGEEVPYMLWFVLIASAAGFAGVMVSYKSGK